MIQTSSRSAASIQLRLSCYIAALWFVGVNLAAAQSLPQQGFSRPQRAVASPNNPSHILEIRVVGTDENTARELAASMHSRVGEKPSRAALATDIELLLATEQITEVKPQWEQRPNGWILTYILSERAPEMTVRAQSDEFSEGGHSSAPRASFPPTRPIDEEDLDAETGPAANVSLEEPLADVRVEGNITIPVSEIQKHIKTRPQRVATQSMIKDDVDALTRTRWFISVRPIISRSEAGLVLTFQVLERPIVRNVEYRGLNKVKREKLEALTNLKVGSPFDVSANVACASRIEEFYHEKGFAFATVELEKGRDPNDREVVFLINEGPKVQVSGVDFEGNQFFSDALLNLKLQTKKRILWSPWGGKYDPATIPNDKASITKYYRSLGYFDMKVDHDLRFNDDKSLVTIVYNIEEGPRFQIRHVEIMGNDVIPEEELRRDHTIQSGEFYVERKLAADVDKMREKYGSLGRLFAKVDAVPRFTEEPGVVDILYRIDEDKVYRVREFNVHIAGDHPHTRLNLVRNISLIQPGDLADPKKIQRTRTRLGGSGYFENTADLAPRLEISRVEDPGWLQLPDLEVARGQSESGFTTARTYFRDAAPDTLPLKQTTAKPPATQTPLPKRSDNKQPAVIESNSAIIESREEVDITPLVPLYQHVLDNASPLPSEAEGEEANLSADPIIRGQDVMLAQGRGPDPEPQRYIYDISPQGDPLRPGINDPGPLWDPRIPPPEFIDIDAYLAEARTGRLMFGAGVNSNSGLVGNIVLSENNFDILRPPTSWDDIWNGTAWRGAGQKFRIEALPGSQVSRYLVDWQDPYFMDTDINLGVSGFYFTRFYRHWDEQRLGGRVRLGKQFSQTWSGSVALRLEQVHIADIPADPPDSLLDVLGDSLLSTAQFTLAHDTRDAAFLPTAGHYVEFMVEQAFAEFNYTRFEIDGRQYFTTYQRPDGGGKHVLNLHGNFGWTSSDTPIYEKFYAGGFQSFRGFAFRGVTPLEKGVEVGGQFMLLGSIEYQIPVMANEMVKVVGFTDFGTVEEDVQFDNFRVAVGGGLRIQVPGMGPVPIALDWAVPVVKSSFDREQLFSFYIGINR